ncbi:aldose epimerase family protein [Halobacillus seohaensis]|uniref:Aldose 1-epimerase n=1 Tax=Halobacillus seohaensis TaxID=447421 RepID=A0ABW2EKW5_9BACI
MQIDIKKLDNEWKQFDLVNDNGMMVSVLNYGGIIRRIVVPDNKGKMENIVLGYKNYEDYQEDRNFFGAIIGRVAGRIEGGSFALGDRTYSLEENDNGNHLHGGETGFHQKVWESDPFQTDDAIGIKLTQTSHDGAGGYPGNLDVMVTYKLNNHNQLIINYDAISDQDTALTLTNHTYFNLSGDLKRNIKSHHVTLDSDRFVELDANLIPTGHILDVVSHFPFDFRQGKMLEKGINSEIAQNTLAGCGYDHYFIFNHRKKENVVVKDESNGRTLHIKTNQPGMVLYTGNNLKKGLQLTEGPSDKYLGVCFETQASPASLHHDGFPSVIIGANEKYSKETTFTFR